MKIIERQKLYKQFTLDKLINTLKEYDENCLINLSTPHCYRGCYKELAFVYDKNKSISVKDFVLECQNCTNIEFYSYKGQDLYYMQNSTPIWITNEKDTSHDDCALIGIKKYDNILQPIIYSKYSENSIYEYDDCYYSDKEND